MKEAVSRKKEAHKTMCQNSTEENKKRYKSISLKSNGRESQKGLLTESKNSPNLD